MFVYTPKSGSKIVARDHSVPVVTLNNGSHHIIGGAVVQVGDGSRAERAAFHRVAAALSAVARCVAIDDRGCLSVVSRRPFDAIRCARMAGLTVDTERAAWQLLASGWGAESCLCEQGGDYSLPLGGGMCVVPLLSVDKETSALTRPDWCGDRGWRWTCGEACWHSSGVDFSIDPAPATVAGVEVGDRDWRTLAECTLVHVETVDYSAPKAEQVAAELAAHWRRSAIGGDSPWYCSPDRGPAARGDEDEGLLVGGPRRGGWAAEIDFGRLTVTRGAESASVWATAAETQAARLMSDGYITAEEAEALTGCDVDGDSVGLATKRVGLVCPDGESVWRIVWPTPIEGLAYTFDDDGGVEVMVDGQHLDIERLDPPGTLRRVSAGENLILARACVAKKGDEDPMSQLAQELAGRDLLDTARAIVARIMASGE